VNYPASQNASQGVARWSGIRWRHPPELGGGLQRNWVATSNGIRTIPADILGKPIKLNTLELSLVKDHARKGYEMLKDVESPWPLAQIIYQHHERMDGSGYPRNLKGEAILIESRILAVADVVEAMSSHRPYRPSLGIEEALKEIASHKGVLYDNDVVNACLRLFREKSYHLPEI